MSLVQQALKRIVCHCYRACGIRRAAISPEMALRIEAWLGLKRGGQARLWLAEQSAYDVWQAQERFKAAPMLVQPAPLKAA